VTLPGSLAVSYVYDTGPAFGTNGSYDSEASRVSKLTVSSRRLRDRVWTATF
jgi:hypothetical protein